MEIRGNTFNDSTLQQPTNNSTLKQLKSSIRDQLELIFNDSTLQQRIDLSTFQRFNTSTKD
ncbi:hypothetical protein BCR33DRAFT_717140, partial [Rhizoclosmatium globosum]